jgi:hypothetical protein
MRRRAWVSWTESRSSRKSVLVEKSQSWRRARSVRRGASPIEKAASRASSRNFNGAGIRACRIARAQGRGASASLGAAGWFGITGHLSTGEAGEIGKNIRTYEILVRYETNRPGRCAGIGAAVWPVGRKNFHMETERQREGSCLSLSPGGILIRGVELYCQKSHRMTDAMAERKSWIASLRSQ